ncbi:MAG: dienelactone hydrolase family protein, partial [Rickettsiales bacterium]|nr:dienelactone hydrolase family protein [Rickettsiales bacterium]
GTWGKDLISLAPDILANIPNTIFIAPNAPYPCEIAPEFYQWFSLVDFDQHRIRHEIVDASQKLSRFIKEQSEQRHINPEQIAVLGFSQGTMVGLYTLLREEKQNAAMLGYSGQLIDGEGLANELQSKPPVCLIHGDQDEVVPYKRMEEAEQYLSEYNIDHECHTCQGMGHSINMFGIETGISFLKRHLTQVTA